VKTQSHGEVQPDQVSAGQAFAEQFLQQRTGGENPFALREEFGKVMWDNVGIVRSGDQLRSALQTISELKHRAANFALPGSRVFNLGWQQALDVHSMLTAAELIATGALAREDSRGAHYRTDFPETDNENWLKNIYLQRDSDGIKQWTEPVKLTRLQPAAAAKA
jgi:succinate dehydrogenase / fumarate reductase flavoprotein subunit/fumarate reductase flavoprotein subunit